MSTERCVCCGEEVPEGRMVCAKCDKNLPLIWLKDHEDPVEEREWSKEKIIDYLRNWNGTHSESETKRVLEQAANMLKVYEWVTPCEYCKEYHNGVCYALGYDADPGFYCKFGKERE